MKHFKFILFLFFSACTLNAQMLKDIVYVEDKNSAQIKLKDEFLKDKTTKYTLVLAKLKKEDDPIEFFRRYKLTNALAYKYGKDKEFTRVLSGVYDNYINAKEALTKLPKELLKFKPYHSRIVWHQKIYNKENKLKKHIVKTSTTAENIISKDTEDTKRLKKKVLNKNPKGYSLVVASFKYKNKKRIITFFKDNGIEDKAVAHLYGKNNNYVKVIYGVYDTYGQAKNDIEKLKSLKENLPYVQKLRTIRNFYKKYNNEKKSDIVKLDVEKKVENEKKIINKEKKNKEIKVLKKIEPIVTKRVLKPEPKKQLKKEPVKVEQKQTKELKKVKKEKKLIGKVLKESKHQDIYYVETKGNFNILNEVFLNEQSSFYTLDLGEIKVEEVPLDKLFIQYNLQDNALVYKYGENNEFARIVYGAYETKNSAKEGLERLKNLGIRTSTKVSNIQEHQKLYKQYHENILKEKKVAIKEEVKKEINNGTQESDFIYINSSNKLKDAFENKDSKIYTITLLTIYKGDIDIKGYLQKNNLNSDVVIYSLGSQNNYYRFFYGAFNSSQDCFDAIENLDRNLKNNKPYVSKINTNIRRFESYNNRKFTDALKNAQMINIK